MNDRRNGDCRIPLSARVWCEDEEVTLYVPAVDVSERGMCVRTGRPLEEGRRVRVGMSGPEGEAVATARVAWSRPTRDTPSAGLHIEEFLRGRDAFERMVKTAREKNERLVDPEPFDS